MRKGVSELVTQILLIGIIASALASIMALSNYVVSNILFNTRQFEHFAIINIAFKDSPKGIEILIVNTGSIDVEIDKVIINNEDCSSSMTPQVLKLKPFSRGSIFVSYDWIEDESYTFIIISKRFNTAIETKTA